MTTLERGSVADGRRIEDGDVGHHAGPQDSSIGQPDASGGTRSHLANGLLEREQMLVANVGTENARKRSPPAGMGLADRQRPVFGNIRIDTEVRP